MSDRAWIAIGVAGAGAAWLGYFQTPRSRGIMDRAMAGLAAGFTAEALVYLIIVAADLVWS